MTTARKTPKPQKPARKAANKSATAKVGAKTTARSAAAPVSARSEALKTAAVPRDKKPRKPKLVRDSFTIPKNEFTVLQDLKQRAGKSGTAAKKSEILRAGIKALAAMNDAAFAAALQAVPAIKTGRPAKE